MTDHTKLMKLVSCALFLAFVLAGLTTQSVQAQDDQEYKRAYNAGMEAAKAKNLPEARTQFARAAQLATQQGDQEIARQSKYVAAQIDYKLGTAAFKAENYEKALEHYVAGTTIYPDYDKNLYGQGLALKNLGRIDDAMAKWQEVRTNNKDRKTVGEAEERIREHFYFQASSAVSKQNPSRGDADQAITALNALKEYLEPDADYYYYLAVAHNIKGEYSQSVSMADQALEMHRGSRTDKAKIYFVKGEALMYSGDNAGAKTAFTNAAFGSYKASAEHYLQTL